jgi:hypothetical protein
MRHWTGAQFNAKYVELSERARAERLHLHGATGLRRIEVLRTLASLDLMTADLFDAASENTAIASRLFEIAAYLRAARTCRTSAQEWRALADSQQARA